MIEAPSRVSFRAMGTVCELFVAGTHGSRTEAQLLAIGVDLVATLEQRWSRFLPDSDVTHINRSAGRWVPVDPLTMDVLTVAEAARAHTNGRYNPLLGHVMTELGYDRSFDQLHAWPGGSVTRASAHPRSGGTVLEDQAGDVAGDIDVDRSARRARIPAGTAIDLGGIGKGYAGDLVVDALLALGGTGVMANLGGDVRVAGEHRGAEHWTIGVGDLDEVVVLNDGAVAYSTVGRRRWLANDQVVHHLIDPATSQPVGADVSMACVVTSAGWWSEALTKSITVAVAQATTPSERSAALELSVPRGDHASVIVDGDRMSTGEWSTVAARLAAESA